MSHQDLYQVLGLYGYQVTNLERDEKQPFVHARPQPHRVCCSACGSREVIRRGESTRTFRNLPIGANCSWVVVTLPRVECRACGVARQVKCGSAEERRTCTRAFERYVLELCRYMTLMDIVRHLGVSWDIVKDIQKRHLQKHFSKPPLKQVTYLGIDEICIGRGHRYITLVLDIDSGAIAFVRKGKSAAALKPFWRRLRAAKAKVKAVAMDLSTAYRSAVEKNLPKATIVFDRFHVIKLYNEKLTQLRRELYRQAAAELQKQVLKGTRWLLLKNHENLDPAKGEPGRLQEALWLNEPLAVPYYLKDDLKQLWEQPTKRPARLKLLDWYHHGYSGTAELRPHAAQPSARHPGLVRSPDLERAAGRHQQQDQNHDSPALRTPRSRVF